MSLIIQFFVGLGATLSKWAIIAVLWVASLALATTSTLVMDAVSDGMSRLLSIQTPYAKSKATVATQRQKIKSTKLAVRRNSGRVKKMAVKTVARNAGEAATLFVPVVGGVMGVSLTLADIYAACELLEMQHELDALFDVAEDPTSWEQLCLSTVDNVEGLSANASKSLTVLKQGGVDAQETVSDWYREMTDAGKRYMSSSTELLAQHTGDAGTDTNSIEDKNDWWVCQTEGMWGETVEDFVLEADKETVLNLQTVAKALGISVATSPELNCKGELIPSGGAEAGAENSPAQQIECSTSEPNAAVDHDSELSFNTQLKSGYLSFGGFAPRPPSRFQCTAG